MTAYHTDKAKALAAYRAELQSSMAASSGKEALIDRLVLIEAERYVVSQSLSASEIVRAIAERGEKAS